MYVFTRFSLWDTTSSATASTTNRQKYFADSRKKIWITIHNFVYLYINKISLLTYYFLQMNTVHAQLISDVLTQTELELQMQRVITLLVTNDLFREEIYNLFLQ